MADLSPDLRRILPARYAYRAEIVPTAATETEVTVSCVAPPSEELLEDLRVALGRTVRVEVVHPSVFRDLRSSLYGLGASASDDPPAPPGAPPAANTAPRARDGRTTVRFPEAEAVVVGVVSELLLQAHRDNATDVHIEPLERRVRVRYRVDGMLIEIPVSDVVRQRHTEIVSRIKVMAGLDIAERRLPQDGRIKAVVDGRDQEYRVSVLPTQFGEAIDIRVLLNASISAGLASLGMWEEEIRLIEPVLAAPHGIVLVTGPTGSGKTTTLYSFLHMMNSPHRKIITIEDPIEYHLDGITQVQVHPEIGLTFARGLRSFLRHDPDVMMVGEIRDSETAETAIRVALTGHLVFSTIHTNDAPSTPARLLDMGAEPYLLASSLRCVIAQRLVRLLCAHCRERDARAYSPAEMGVPDSEFSAVFDSGDSLSVARGCPECLHTGYRGRTAIFEIMLITPDVHDAILARASARSLRESLGSGFGPSMRARGLRLAASGVTSVQEVLRVTTGAR